VSRADPYLRPARSVGTFGPHARSVPSARTLGRHGGPREPRTGTRPRAPHPPGGPPPRTRSRSPNLVSTCPTCVLTVVSLTNSSAAISALDRPRATSFSTSTSRSVSACSGCGTDSSPDGSRPAYLSSSRRVMLGASIASPAATTRIACTSSAAGASLSRKPLAPARSASTTYSSRSKVVSTSTFAGPERSGPVICRVASTPSIRGIRMSISTTSGCSARTWSSAC
jgi:hypothetical protein